MKKYIKFCKAAAFTIACLVMFFGCKKDDDLINYSERPTSQNLFLSISGTGNLNRTQNLSILSTTGGTAAVGLNLTKASGTDITATIGVDTTKVNAYNAANNTQFRLLPAANYDLQAPTNGLTIKAGSLFSADSVKVTFKNLKGLRSSNYLLPVTILKASGNTSAILSDSVKTVYINLTLTDVKQPSVSILMASGNSTSISYPVGATGAASATPVTIQVSPASPNNITVNVVADNSKIAGYGSGYTAFPDGSYTLSASSVVVNAGQTAGTFNINIPDLSKFDGTKTYLLPVTISKISGDEFALRGTTVAYVQLSFNNLNNANNTSATGNRLLNRQGWMASASSYIDFSIYGPQYSTFVYPPSNVLDGNLSTDWAAASGNQPDITLDMGTLHALKTISYDKAYSNYYASIGYTNYPSSVKVYTSTDGINWKPQGTYQPISDTGGASSPAATNYINFYNAISARYVKLQLITAFGAGGFSEINVYE